MPRGAWLVLLLSGLVGVASPARAQFRPQWGNGGVRVDPFEGFTSAPSGSSGNTVTFTVTNTGEELDSYSLECGRTGQVTACSLSTWWIELDPSGSMQVTVTFSAGGPGSGTVTLLASSLSLWANSPVEATGSYDVTVPFVYAVSVTALDGPDSLGYSASGQFTFEVRNTGNVSNTYTFLSTVTGPGSAGQITPGSAALGPGAATVVTAVLNAGNIPGQASIILTANGSGSATDNDALTVTVYGPSVFTLAYAPSDKLERSECLITGAGPSAGAQCGDLLYTHALPAYRTLNRARSVTLLYNSGLANPRSVVAVDYTQFAGQPVPEMLRLQIQRVSGGAILDVVHYGTGSITNNATRTFRLVIPSTQAISQAEPIEVLASRKFGGAWGPPEVKPARLLVNGWQDSPFGAGWWVGIDPFLWTPS